MTTNGHGPPLWFDRAWFFFLGAAVIVLLVLSRAGLAVLCR